MSRYPLLIIVIFLASCKNCTRYTRAWVVDHETNKAIYNAEVKSHAALNDRTRDQRTTFTDTSGWFETAFELNGVAKCGNLKLIISHPDYETGYEVDVPVDDTIFLRRLKK